ncbi:MAG TPA: glycoside hydrolase family 9 [Ruminococcus sp.]|nr:glycoside hydrolase family 9 [Ruminococcus sp.]
MHRRTKMAVASILAAATVAPMAVTSIAPLTASAADEGAQILGETDFTYKALPWHTCETSPAKQNFRIEDGAFHVTIKTALGGAGAKWDLQFRHRNLNFYAGETYKVSFQAKAKRNGMELCSKIGNIKGDEEYFDLKPEGFVMGPHMGGGGMGWGSPVKLTTEYQTWSGTFTPTQDLKGVEWAFHYAKGTNGEGGNAEDKDEIWFDNMSIVNITSDKGAADPNASYGATNRHFSGLENNYISVNQLGYFPDLAKIAVLGDNKGDILHGAESINLSGTYTWELVNASSGAVATSGTTTAPTKDADSADSVCKIDFSDYKTPGTYYLRIKGQDWRSFEFKIGDDIYTDTSHNMLTNAINYFYQNRSGMDIESAYITSGNKTELAHPGGHKVDTASVQKIWKNEYAKKTDATGTYASSTITANKGWYDAGDHGKYVVNGGIAVWTLQNMYERSLYAEDEAVQKKFDDNSGTVVIPEAGNDIPDVLDECKYELDFISDMKVESTEPTWGQYAGLYYHKLHDHKWTGLATKPWDYEGPTDQGGWDTVRIVKPPTFAATLNYAACAAQAARLWEPYNKEQAATYLKSAKEAYQAYKKYYYEADMTPTEHPDGFTCTKEEIREDSLYAPMFQAKGGGPYGDNEVRDDGYWAACEIFISAQKMGDADAATYLDELSAYKNAFEVTTRITGGENKDGSLTTFNWGNTASAGSLSLAMHKDLLEAAGASASDIAKIDKSIKEAADTYIQTEAAQGYGIPYLYDGPGYNDPNNLDPDIIIKGYEWGSNSMVINNLIVMAYAHDLTGDVKYLNGVTQGMDYLLGTNPLSFSYITGYGSYHEKRPHHRYWSKELDESLPEAPDGVLSGGPNAGLQDPYVRALGFVPGEEGNPSQRCFVDSIEAWSTNEVTINWNAPLAWIVEFLQDKDTKYSYGGDPIPPTPTKADWGNTDCSEGKEPRDRVDVGDAVLLARFLAEDSTATITEQGQINANVVSGDGLTSADTTKILKYVAFMIDYDELGTESK